MEIHFRRNKIIKMHAFLAISTSGNIKQNWTSRQNAFGEKQDHSVNDNITQA